MKRSAIAVMSACSVAAVLNASSKTKIPALALRKPGDPHPYVIGAKAVQDYLTVAGECTRAVLAGMN